MKASSLTFGPTGTEATVVRTSMQDVNGDGRPDMVCQFTTTATHFTSGDTQGVLKGTLSDGTAIRGTDSVKIVR
ncbi:MAG: hypothetical protein ACXV3D_07545 [Halobacteriota archaeon]